MKRLRKEYKEVIDVFAENMYQLIENRGWTFEKLEELTGIPSSSLNNYARGSTNISVPAAKKIAEVFGLKVDDMLKEDLILKKEA